jgi:tetratricopeptide (TPR) repeat protein
MKPLSIDDREHLSVLVDNLAASPTSQMEAYERSCFYRNIVEIQFLVGQIEAARKNINYIADLSERVPVAEWMAKELASIGEIDTAMEIARELFELSYQSSAIANVAKHVYSTSSLDAALVLVDEIPNPETRWETCLFLCRAEAQAGKYRSAYRIAEKIKFASFRAWALLAVAECYENCSDQHESSNKFNDVLDVACEVEDHLVRSTILFALANALIARREKEKAKPILQLAASFASMVEDPLESLEALLNCGIGQISISDFETAKKTAKDVSFALEYVDWSYGKANTLRGRVVALATAVGEYLDGITCDSTLATFNDLNDLLGASHELATAGFTDDATVLAEKAVELLLTLDPSEAEIITGGFSHASLTKCDLEHAITIAKKVEEIHGSISITLTDICAISEFIAENVGREQAIQYLRPESKKISLLPLDFQELAYKKFLKSQEIIGDDEGIKENANALARVPIEYCSDTEITKRHPLKALESDLIRAIAEGDWGQTKKIMESIESISEKTSILASALKM